MNPLVNARNELLDCQSDALSTSLFILLDTMVEAGDSNISASYGDIGINITSSIIEIVNIETGIAILTLERR